jgi:hypothetical protein
MRDRLDASQVFVLQTREIMRAYVRELAGWDQDMAKDDLLAALEQIEHAEQDPKLAAELLAAEPSDLDELISGSDRPQGEQPEAASSPGDGR